MKLVMVHGNGRHGSTWHYADMLREALAVRGAVEVREFSMPQDLTDHCLGCFNCFMKGEDKCPHAAKVAPIAEAIAEADVIVLTSPVYALDVSGGMKTLLDHLCYRWIIHRPDPRLFSAVGVTVSTTAGAGLGHAAKTMRNSLRFWGVRHALSLKMPVAAAEWNGVSEKKRARMQASARRVARKIERLLARPLGSLMRRMIFLGIRQALKADKWNERDREYWRDMGWLDGGNPFRTARDA